MVVLHYKYNKLNGESQKGRTIMNYELNRKKANGSWVISIEYSEYRSSGGELDPEAWNCVYKEIINEQKIIDELKEIEQ